MDDHGHSPDGRPEAAKRFGRRATLKLLGLAFTGAAAARAAGAEPAVSQAPAPHRPPIPFTGTDRRGRAWSLRPLATGTTPRYFAPAEFATLGAVVGLILPDTDTPGAATAGVHWYLDDVAAVDRGLGGRLRNGLRRIDERAMAAHRRPFGSLPAEEQLALLSEFDDSAGGHVEMDSAAQPRVTGASAATDAVTPDDRTFFALIKSRTIDAYYKSEMGQIGELEWVGHEFNDEFPGACSHAHPLVHPRPRWPRARA